MSADLENGRLGPLTRLPTLATLSPKGARAVVPLFSNIENPKPLQVGTNPITDFSSAQRSTQVGSCLILVDGRRHTCLNVRSFPGEAKVVEHHAHRQHCGHRVRDVLPRVLWS